MPPVEAAFQRVQRLQQLDHPASAVVRPCRQVPSSLAARAVAPTSADALGRLSDLAYGYRVTPRGLARRAASAGAMYPIELAWVTHDGGRWRLRYFDPLRQGCADLGGDDLGRGDRCAGALGLRPGEHAALLTAVAWRTVQRYGVRGYRYCLLDAGHVLGNLAVLAAAAGAPVRLPPAVPHELLRAELGLARDELLLAVAVLGGDPGSKLPPPPGEAPPAAFEAPLLFGTEQPPLLAPAMERIRRLHALSSPGVQLPLDLAGLLGRHSVPDAIGDVLRRCSARSFAAVDLAAGPAAALSSYVDRVPLTARLVTRTPEWSGPALASMFGDQPIAATAAAFAVLGLPAGGAALPEYRQALLAAGVACAGGYLLAAREGLATTVLGGFDDRRVSRLAGGGITPLVVQAFGPAEDGVDVKNDTLAATWLDNRRGAG